MADTAKAIPDGYTRVAPWIVTRDTAKQIAFMEAAFGGEELSRVLNPDGSIGHAEVRLDDFVVLLFDAKDDWPDTPALLRMYTSGIDEVFDRAIEAGAVTVTDLRDSPWGDRGGRIRDPLGNIWWLVERTADVAPELVEQRWGEARYLEAMAYAQDSLDRELRSRT